MCDVCNNESCDRDIGVAAIPGVPMSIMWGNKCLTREKVVVPDYTCRYFFIYGGRGDINKLVDEVRQYWTWADGKYMTLPEYCKRITPEMVEKELKAYDDAMRN